MYLLCKISNNNVNNVHLQKNLCRQQINSREKIGKIKRDEKLRIQGLKNEIVPQIIVGKSRMLFHRMRTTF